MLLKQIQYFLAVAECRHFTRAAERLFVSQSALSQQITKLENDLNTKLINRDSHPIELTPAGEDFRHYAQYILRDVDQLHEGMKKWQKPHKHTIHIGMIMGLGRLPLSDFLAAFNTRYPETRFTLEHHLSKELCQLLAENQLDFAIFAAPQNIQSYPFEILSIQQEPFLVLLPQHHPFAAMECIDLALAKKENFIFPTPENVSYDILLTACEDAGFKPDIISYCSGAANRIDLVKAGLGISIVSESALRYHQTGDLVIRPLKNPVYKHTVMARLQTAPSSAYKDAFWKHVQQELS
ncbi:LysR family transcriptional regulator [Mitsuokella sp.]|uniref:LysR family transcriptional regulator n=1 Tax=Mitsuokella TaxID=52225 RepID=UPI0029DF14E0|nr:LysR family transcriptional regulator [Mitsuokella sp.]MDD6382066.1 LysR family transcriptional regulator [Selenomonadaceae bacterium]MDY4474684.1 LysR family transcriptional regulator [Mitsuokella sp.]